MVEGYEREVENVAAVERGEMTPREAIEADPAIRDADAEIRRIQDERVYSKENMPVGFDEEAKKYRKHALTRAARVKGPFTVETSEGPLRCEDGYLAVDARGYPYPIAADEFELIYEEATEVKPFQEVWFVFNGSPGPTSPGFVEIETELGEGIATTATWEEYGDTGLWKLGPFLAQKEETDGRS